MMSFARSGRFAFAAALLSAIAVLFVSTVSMARDVVDDRSAAMSMSHEGAPCEPATTKAVCHQVCLMLCQAVLPQIDRPAPSRIFTAVSYAVLNEAAAGFTGEAEDPPPRA